MSGRYIGPSQYSTNYESKPDRTIHLSDAADRQTRADDAGVDIITTRLGSRVRVPAPYDNLPPRLRRESLDFVPPLAYYCITVLCTQTLVVDDAFPALIYASNKDQSTPDILKALIPSYNIVDASVELSYLRPNLWLTLAMLYTSTLPASFRVLNLPLQNPHVPCFQTIEPLPRFTLITTLDLSYCRQLSDTNIYDLKDLHQLAYLNLSGTEISSGGIYQLSRTLRVLDDQSEMSGLMGPWKLRVLRLNRCQSIDDKVGPYLSKWPLLCLVDLGDTGCDRPLIPGWPVPHKSVRSPIPLSSPLFLPTDSATTLRHLHSQYPDLFPHETEFPYVLALRYVYVPKLIESLPTIASRWGQNSYVVVPSAHSQRPIELGEVKTEAQEEFFRRQRARDEAQRRERELRSGYEYFDEGAYPGGYPGSECWDFHSEQNSDDYNESDLGEWDQESGGHYDESYLGAWDQESGDYYNESYLGELDQGSEAGYDTEEEFEEMNMIAEHEWERDVADQKMRDFYTPIVPQPMDQPVPSLGCILTRRPPPFTETLAKIGKFSGEALKLRESEEHARRVMAGETNVRAKRKHSVDSNSCSKAPNSKSVPTAAPLGPSGLWRRLRGRYDKATTPSPRDDVLAGSHCYQELSAATRITPFGRPSTSRVPADPKPSSSIVASRPPSAPPDSIKHSNSKAPVLVSSSHTGKRKPSKAANTSTSKRDMKALPVTKRKKLSQGDLRSFFKSSA